MRAVVLLLLVSGCLPTIDIDPPAKCDVLPFHAAPKIIPRGVLSQVDVPLLRDTCLPAELTVAVEVYDAKNLPVPNEFTLEVGGRSAVVHLSLVPQNAGPLQIIATFSDGAREVRTLYVVEPPPVSVSFSSVDAPCDDEVLTTSGAWLCRAGAQVTVWRQGMLLQTLPALELAGRGDVVWLIGPGVVERFVDAGGSFLRRDPDLAMPANVQGPVIALESSFVSNLDGALQSFTLDGSTLKDSVPVTLPRGLCVDPPQFRVQEGDPRVSMSCQSRAGHVRLCGLQLDAIDASPCLEFSGTRIAFEGGRLWLLDGNSVIEATLSQSRTATVPEGFSSGLAGVWFQNEGWPLLETIAGGQLLVLPGPQFQLPPAGANVLGHGSEGILVLQSNGTRSVIQSN